jgi:hypothetical protein
MEDSNDSVLELRVVSDDELARVSGGAGDAWDQYAASVKGELEPLLRNPTPEVKSAVCGVVGFRGAGDLQSQTKRPGERAKVGAARALEAYCNAGSRLPTNAIFQ